VDANAQFRWTNCSGDFPLRPWREWVCDFSTSAERTRFGCAQTCGVPSREAGSQPARFRLQSIRPNRDASSRRKRQTVRKQSDRAKVGQNVHRSVKRRVFVFLVSILIATAHRLPAPIQEIPESPTPIPKAQVKPKKTQSKPRSIESEATAKSTPKPVAMPTLQGPARFAGTWTGTINQGVLGDVAVSLVTNAAGTSVQEVSRIGTFTHPATISANIMTWKAGWLSEIAWTLIPNNDGKTAAVTSKSAFGVNGSATFRRQ